MVQREVSLARFPRCNTLFEYESYTNDSPYTGARALLEDYAKRTGLSQGQIVRDQLERVKAGSDDREFLRLTGTVDGPKDLSERKGFSRP